MFSNSQKIMASISQWQAVSFHSFFAYAFTQILKPAKHQNITRQKARRLHQFYMRTYTQVSGKTGLDGVSDEEDGCHAGGC